MPQSRSFSTVNTFDPGQVVTLPLHLLPTPVFPGELVPVRLTSFEASERDSIRSILRASTSKPVFVGVWRCYGRGGSTAVANVGCLLELKSTGGLEDDSAEELSILALARQRVAMRKVYGQRASNVPLAMADVEILADADAPLPRAELRKCTFVPELAWSWFDSELWCERLWTLGVQAGIISPEAATRASALVGRSAATASDAGAAAPTLQPLSADAGLSVGRGPGRSEQQVVSEPASAAGFSATSGTSGRSDCGIADVTPANAALPQLSASAAAAQAILRRPWQVLGHDPTAFSYWLCRNLPAPPADKQQWLQHDSTLLRLQAAGRFLEQLSVLRCRRCGVGVAKYSDVVAMSESGVSALFSNPHGVTFRIVTAQRVSSDATELSGPPELQDSWYPGYAWSILSCASCRSHLGWRFDWVGAEMPTIRPLVWSGSRSDWVERAPVNPAAMQATLQRVREFMRSLGLPVDSVPQMLAGTDFDTTGGDDSDEDEEAAEDDEDGEAGGIESDSGDIESEGDSADEPEGEGSSDATERELHDDEGEPGRDSNDRRSIQSTDASATSREGGRAAFAEDRSGSSGVTTVSSAGSAAVPAPRQRAPREGLDEDSKSPEDEGAESAAGDIRQGTSVAVTGAPVMAGAGIVEGEGARGTGRLHAVSLSGASLTPATPAAVVPGPSSSGTAAAHPTTAASTRTLRELVGPPPGDLPAVFFGLRHEAVTSAKE